MRTAKLIITGCLLALLLIGVTASGWTDELSIAADLGDRGELSFRRSLAGVPDPGLGITVEPGEHERGTLAHDTIRGNGTRAGYMLTHGGVVANSETVTVGGSFKARNKDYYLDCANGSLMFAEPVRVNQGVSVSYRYVPEKDRDKAGTGPALALSFGPNTTLGMSYAYRTYAKNPSVDLSTYGLNLSSKLGANSTMNNMMYVTSVRDSGRTSLNMLDDDAQKSQGPKPKSDNLFVHNSDLQTGKLNLKIDYQDVGEDFIGFDALRQQKAASDDVLKQLENEKGIVRFGMQAGYDLGQGASAGMGMSRISDDGGDIMKQSLSIGNDRLKLSANMFEIDKGFKRFKDLSEKESTQWAKLAGVKQTDLSLAYTPKQGLGASLGMQQSSDEGGDITQRSLTVGNDRLKLSAEFLDVDDGFKSFTGLDDGRQLALQAGTKRSDIQLGFTPKEGFGAELGMLAISDENGQAVKQSLKVGNDRLKLSLNTQEIDKEFSRIQGLGDVQWGQERGMKRTDMQLSLAPLKGMDPKSVWNALSMNKIEDESGEFSSRSLEFAGKSFSLSAFDTSIDPEFARLRDLSTSDYQDMALDIYRQFDPDAKESSISRYDLQAMTSEAGMERRNIRGGFQFGSTSLSLQMLNVGDETGGIERQTLSLQGGNYKITGLLQSIDDEFTRVSSLAPIEQKHFGSEYGMERMNLTGDLTLKSGLKLGTSFARVSDGDAGFLRYGLGLANKKLNLTANFRNIDPEFDRIMDLADKDRRQLALEQGMSAYDLNLDYKAGKSLKVNSFFYDAKHATDESFRRELTNSIVYNPARGPKVTLFRDQLDYGYDGLLTNYLHQKMTLDHKFGTLAMSALYDTEESEASDGEMFTAETQGLHLETDPKRRTSLAADWKNMEQSDGEFLDSYSLTLKSQLSSNLTFAGSRSLLKTDRTEKVIQDYSLSGKVFGNTTLAIKFGEHMIDGNAFGRTRELSVVPGKQMDIGFFKNANWKFSFAETEAKGETQKLSGAATFAADICGMKLAYEHLTGLTPIRGKKTGGDKNMSRSFKLTSDQDPKKALHFDLMYKVMDPGPGDREIIRAYNADYTFGSAKLTYKYSGGSEPTAARRYLVPTTENLKLTTVISKKLNFVGQWNRLNDLRRNTEKDTLSLGLSGKVSALSAVEASYEFDRVVTNSGKYSARTYRLKYDYQVSADHFVTVGGKYTDWSGSRPSDTYEDDLRVQLDFKTLFD